MCMSLSSSHDNNHVLRKVRKLLGYYDPNDEVKNNFRVRGSRVRMVVRLAFFLHLLTSMEPVELNAHDVDVCDDDSERGFLIFKSELAELSALLSTRSQFVHGCLDSSEARASTFNGSDSAHADTLDFATLLLVSAHVLFINIL